MRPSRVVFAVLASVALGAGCGLPADSSPRNIDLSEQPIGLPPAPPPADADEVPGRRGPFVWFLVADNGLELRAVSRDVANNYEAMLETLLQGPTAAEQSEGVLNQIPAGTRLLNVSAPDEVGTLAVDLSEEFLSSQQGASVGNALGQIVFTAMEDQGVQRVVVTVAGVPYPWVIGDARVLEGVGMTKFTFPHLNPTEYPTTPGVNPPAATERPTTTDGDRPPDVN